MTAKPSVTLWPPLDALAKHPKEKAANALDLPKFLPGDWIGG